jgi:hypothetical protein
MPDLSPIKRRSPATCSWSRIDRSAASTLTPSTTRSMSVRSTQTEQITSSWGLAEVRWSLFSRGIVGYRA